MQSPACPRRLLRNVSLLALGALVAAVSSHGDARAAWPPDESKGPVDYSDPANWPNDPDFGGEWSYWSFLPKEALNRPGVSAQNKRLGAGSHLDRAWAKTTGDRRVLISVLDSGANWSNDDLANKWFLNRGELPEPDAGCGAPGPKGDPHDRNGDGVFNVQDYIDTNVVKPLDLPLFTAVCDTRIKAKGDVNANAILDPQDLIAAFSDGKDGDANGYVDDISGWDFFHDDNDPYDDTQYGHGDGESKDSSRQGNNGRGGIGTCPDCSVELLRVGDSFTTDGSMFGMATLYAVDIGSSVIQEALGNLNDTQLSRDALDYAYVNHVAVIASAADENSYHHNKPGTNNRTYYVHAVTFDTNDWRNARTFLNFNNCTNYGSNLAASVPAATCSSGAVGSLSGITGLLYAAALKADIPYPQSEPSAGDANRVRRLTAEEVYQILSTSADDLYDPADATDPTRYPTRMGWDQRFGHGRINARSAVDMVLAEKLPPEVELRGPEWYEVLFPERTPKVKIDGRVQVGHAAPGDTVDWVLEWAPGTEPDDSAFKSIASANMMGGQMGVPGVDGALADWDISGLHIDNPTQGPPDNVVNRRMVTLRLRATVHSMGPRDGLKAEARRAVFVEREPDLVAGFPVRLRSSGEMSGKMVDLDGDGKREFVMADASGFVHAFRGDGSEASGWPVKTEYLPHVDPMAPGNHRTQPAFVKGKVDPERHVTSAFSIASADLDGDGRPEVICASYYGKVWVWRGDGSVVSGWPFTIDRSTATQTDRRHIMFEGILAAPALADFTGDGKPEIVIATMNSLLYVLGGDGRPLPSWNGGQPLVMWDTAFPDDPKADPSRLRDRMVSSPALGDLNGDGVPEIVVGTNENYEDRGRLYAVDGKSAKILPGWPIELVSKYILPLIGSGCPNAPALADLDGDKIPEVLISGIAGPMRAFTADGKLFKSAEFGGSFNNSLSYFGAMSDARENITVTIISSPSIGDLDEDGVLDVVMPTAGIGNALGMANGGTRQDSEHHVSAWDSRTGLFKPGFPRRIEDYQFFNSAAIADVDGEGDGRTEVIEGSGGYWVHAFRADGSEPAGWPKFTGGWVTATAAVGDMDGDGTLEVALPTRDGFVWAWHTRGKTGGRIDWPGFHHDNANTGNFSTKLDQGRGPGTGTGMVMGSGCSCGIGGRGGAAGAWLVAGLLLMLLVSRSRGDMFR